MEEKDFDGCSYAELTRCIYYRVEKLKEFREFLKDRETGRKYPSVRSSAVFTGLRYELQIKKLMKMRRRLRKSPYCNWYTVRIEEYERSIKEKVVDIRKYQKLS